MSDIEISDDKSRLDLNFVHGFLSQSYWAKDIPKSTVAQSIENAWCFGVYLQGQQIGFARLITDYTTFAYLADVFIAPEFQGRGYSKQLMSHIEQVPVFQSLRRVVLCTGDAHGLYRQFGFTNPAQPEIYMERWQPNIYRT